MSTWASYDEKFEALSKREKWLAMLAGIALIALVGFTYGVEPLIEDNSDLAGAIANKEAELMSLETQEQAYTQALALDPNIEYQEQLAELQLRMQNVEQEFSDELADLVSPSSMPALMNEVLSLSGSLSLEAMENIPPENIFAGREDMQGAALYQHAIRLTFNGGYQQIQRFLAELEGTQWQVYWRTMHYDVAEFPEATLTIEFYTLSTDEELLRV